MSKEIIKKTVTNNKVKFAVAILAMLLVLVIVGINVYANNSEDYAVEIKDDGALNIAQDENSSVTKKIVEDTTTSLTYELQVKNLGDSTRIPEVAIVIDSSRSMEINDATGEAKVKALQLVTELLSNSPRTKISISSNSGIKTGMSKSSLATYTNAINAITYSDGESVAKAIDYAASSFSAAETDKYMIIFSDATDSTKEKLELLTGNGIRIYTILPDITNNEFESNTGSMGVVQNLSDISDFSYIYNKTNVSLNSVKVTDIFTDEAKEYFDFEVISKENDVDLEQTDDGYILKCNDIKVGETRTFKYKMTLKEDANIDAGKIYRTLNSSNNIKIEYTDPEEETHTYEMEKVPTFVICKKYSLTIKAVSEKSNDLPVENLDIKVVGTTVVGQDLAGNDIVKTIYDETLTTDSKGRILIDELKTLGDINFEIKPLVDQFGYSETSATEIIVHNDPTGVGTIWAESDVTTPEVDVVERNITVLLPISVATYEMEIATQDINDDRVILGDIEYRLIQPKLNSKYEMEALYGTSDSDGKLVLKPAIMTKDGSYQYILSQMTSQDGYDPMGNVTLIVTFENGKVTKIAHEYNERVTTELISNSKTKVIVGNEALNDNTFNLEINLQDALTNQKLFGAIYDIVVTRTTVAGEQVTSELNGYMTDEKGQVNIEIPGSGYINLKITEKAPKAGYVADTVVKDITFLRKNGTVQYISSKNPTSLNVIADSSNNKVVVNLTSELANEQNRIQVNLTDSIETDVNVIGAILGVNKVGDTQVIQGYTDRNGIANFIIPDEEQGSYQYEISLISGAPAGYLAPSKQLGIITANFDSEKHVVSASVVSNTTPSMNVSVEQMLEGGYLYDTAKVQIGLEPDPASAYSLKIALLDGSNMSKGVAGAKYSIQMESDGVEVKYLAGKLTDANGNYTTRIIGGGQNITITITETATLKGYILTTTTQVIELELQPTGGYIIANSSPNIYDPSNKQYIGAELKGTELIYHDVNHSKTAENTILNLHVNEMDTNDFLVSGVKVRLKSDTLLDADGSPLDKILDSNGDVIGYKDNVTDQNGYFQKLGIKVNAKELNNGERIDYLYINEIDVDGNAVQNTDITLKLTFRENKETAIVEVTNVEATWGNRLVKQRTFSSRETDVAYESDVYLDLYTNFDDVGNFSLDLKKVDKDGNTLPGAKYDVVVMRPDSTRFVRRDITVNDNVELEGILVSQGTKIEVTEKVAPIGYELNQYTEVLTITEVNTITGLVTCELEPSSYATPRANISNTQPIVLADGSYKLSVTLDLIDYEMDTFKFGIKAQDSTTTIPVSGYSFNVFTSEGAQQNTPATNSEGKTMVQVGANYKIENYEVTYTVDTLKVADYYKELPAPIEVKIIFDLNGNVMSTLTYAANQSQPGYGTIWTIDATNTTNGNDIDILINIDPCDPLVVNVQTIDTLNNQALTNVEYAITPTINLPGTGTTRLESGYVLPGGIKTYTIKQTNASSINNYQPIEEQQIKIVYDSNGDIVSLDEVTDKVHEISINGKEVTIKIDIEPRVPFTITNTGYFDNLNLANGKFEISVSDTDSRELVTDINGEDITYIGEFGTDSSTIYTVKQTEAAYGYAKIEDFQIEVFFDTNRNIVDAQILGDVNKYVQFVDVTYTTPSTSEHKGYNGNDRGIVNISVKNYPDVQFSIENVDRRDNTMKLAGTTYKVESSISTKDESIVTDSNGIGIANLDKSGYETTVTYTIIELTPAARYQPLAINAVIEVDFNNLGYIIGTPRVIKSSDVVTATIPEQNTDADKFKVDIKIENNPQLSINITKVDEEDTSLLLPRVEFELTARIVKDNLSEYSAEDIEQLTLNSAELTEENYLSQVIDRLKINREDVEQIRQDIGIENLIKELKDNNNLTAEEEDEISTQVNNNLKINKIVSLGKATKTQVYQKINAVTNRAILDKLIENEVTTEDRVNELLETVKNLVRLDVDTITTDVNGVAIAYMDKTLANKTIEYTVKETKKADGYDWLDEVVIFEVTYDAEGKMITENPVKVVSGSIEITSVDQNNFAISAVIKNKPSDEVRIHLTVEDVYDSNKKLETAAFDAYLIDTSSSVAYSPDGKYRVALESGSQIGNTGLITAHGEDTEVMGVYEEGAGTRVLRLVQTKVPTSYYIGNDKYDSAYQSIGYALLVQVTFNDEGSITGTSLYRPGEDTRQIGYVADGRYIQVSHTRNTINVTIKYYPMLQVQMQTVDMYTGQSLRAGYTVDTRMWGSTTNSGQVVSSGYIDPYFTYSSSYFGRTYSAGYTTNTSITTVDEAARVTVSPIEADTFGQNIKPDTKERILHVYENAEPTSPIQYQTYLPRHFQHSSNYLLAKVKVQYNDLGEITNVDVIQANSSNNIKSGFFTAVKATFNEHTIQIVVKYAPITTISTTVIDEVSGAGLSGIRINPYLGGTGVTTTSYEYRTTLYYTTGNSGKTGWTYWGASQPNTLNRYILDTYTTGSGYDGYFDPQNIILDVSYDENGRISAVTPKSTDAFGDVNAIDISWSNNNINVTIRYCRKFNVQLNKVDYNDSNKRLSAAFDVVSSEETRVSMAANTATTLGKIYPGKMVRYTLSETTVPNGYIPIENLDILVQFNSNGTIRSATSESSYYQFLSSAPADNTTNSLRKVDLIANIKNKPRFDVSIELSDEFYPTLKLEGGTFTIENDKGDVSSGGVQTDKNGILQTYVGTVYPNEDVTYTVKQTNTIAGYYANSTIMQFKVHFNANGKVETYSLIAGTGVATMNPTKHVGTQEITLNVVNMPKDVKLGIYKYDGLTNSVMSDVSFTLKTEESGRVTTQKTVVTNADGTAAEVVDTFKEQTSNRIVKYTISEVQAAQSYRKIQDVVIQVTYKEDGTIFLYDVLSNPSNVGVEIATNKQIKYVSDVPVHIKLTIPNDNAYDLIVKNEDTNYAGLGIEGTVYDVSINGEAKNPITTNSNGIASINNQTQNGEIEIVITERTIGEGYRADNNNTVTFKLEKGTEIYSLDFVDGSNSNPTYATVVVDEEHGTVTVTFKNETKLELTMQKEDINTGDVLEGVVFEIKEEELDSSGNVIEGTENIITTDEANTTDANGLLYFDLGLSKQNKIMKYTFTETTAPEGYTQILPVSVTVTFDAYGHIQKMTDDSFRVEETLASSTGKSHHMIVIIGNGTVNEAYTVKIVTEDSQSGRRINGSIFQVEAIETATGATNKSMTGATKDVTRKIAGNMQLFEKGALRVTGVRAEGDVQIKFSQIETATGYVYGSNQTSGTITINAAFDITESSQEKEVTLSLVDNAGYDVSVDNINREITIKVLNDPQVTFEITKVDADTGEALKDVKFNISSAIVSNGVANSTGFSEDAKLTDKDGYTEANVGYSYDGKTVVYTLVEEQIQQYKPLNNIVLSVQYDADGNIAEYKVLSNKNDITIKQDSTKTITKRILSENNDIPGVVDIEYSNITIPTGIGSRILQMEVKNSKIPSDYRIEIGKYHEDTSYPYLIPGAKYEITVTQEYGKATTTWTDITDQNGVITSPYFSGHGLIEIFITEVSAPEGFKLDNVTKTTRLYRNPSNGKMIIQSTDSGCTFNEDYSMVYLKAVDQVVSGAYDIVINKVDAKTGALIVENPAIIKLDMLEKHETVTQTLDEETGEIIENVEITTLRTNVIEQETDENGRIATNTIKAPTIPGEYTYILSEVKAPTGYEGIEEDEVEILVTFDETSDQDIVITNVAVKDSLDVKAARTSNKLMNIMVYNTDTSEEDTDILNDNEIGLDIRKVDTDLVQVTTGTAEFTLIDGQTNEETQVVTDELGRAELVKIKIPEEAGNYKYTLKETKAPKGYKLNEEDMDIIMEFLEDEDGNIYLNKVTTVGSNLIYANQVSEGQLPDKKLKLRVVNEDLPYTVVVEKHHEQDPEYPYFIPDVEFDIKVTEEFGIKTTEGYDSEVIEWTDITNSDGIIVRENFEGYGRIKVEITEKSAPDKYQIDTETRFIEFYRDKDSKELRQYDSNVNYELDEENQKIILKPSNEVNSGIYDLVINKVDKSTNMTITDTPAEFNLYMINEYESTQIKVPIIKNGITDNLGMIVKDSIELPREEGIYKFELEEVKAPVGYEGLQENAEFEMTIEKNEDDDLVITNVSVTKGDKYLKVLKFKEQFIALSVANENNIPEGKVALSAIKVDEENNRIKSDTAVFKVIDNQTKEVYYMETDENAIAEKFVDIPESAGQYSYTINEIKAPNGYILDRKNIEVILDYEESQSGEIYLNKVTVNGANAKYEQPEEGELPSERIEIKVTNILGSNGTGTGNTNDKPYTVVINKKDSQTKQNILDSATFDVSLVNGEIIHAATNTEGQIIIENVYMPATPGEYEIVVKELSEPEGYMIDSEMKIVKVTFAGIGNNMTISDIQLTDANNKNIEIVTEQCTDDKIVLDVFNEQDDLYVVSKKNGEGEYIYDVLKSYEGRHYSLDNPFIDTKVAKYGSNMNVQEFIDNLDSNGVLTVWDNNGNQLDSTDRVKTGMTLKATKGNKQLTFTIVVKGDCDGDGRVRTKDSDALIKHLSGESIITNPIALRALDLMSNGADGRIRTTDLNELYNVMARG